MRALTLLLAVLPLAAQSTTRPVIRGREYAVSSMKPEASQVAERVLRAGGNAFDAAVAAQAVLGLTDPANNGVGSDALLLLFDAASGKPISLNGGGTAPRLATIEWYRTHAGGKLPDSDGLLAATVPGVVDVWYVLLDRWGTRTFGELLEPAIRMASDGFALNDRAAGAMRSRKIQKYPSSMKVFQPDGRAPHPGEIFRYPLLAKTLQRLVDAEKAAAGQGRRAALKAARDEFYKGSIAREMAEFSERNGGLFRYEDFASYTARVEDPISVDYRGYRVYKNPSNNQGPAELLALNLLEGFDLKALKLNSPEYIHAGVEAIKLAMADRDKYMGDEEFVPAPWRGLLSKEYARERRALIDPAHASLEYRPGVAEKYQPGFSPVNPPVDIDYAAPNRRDGDTSYLVIVDRQRNVVSFTPSLHSGFGTGVVMGDLGFVFNCRGDYFSLVPGHANALAPGRRPRSTLTSVLVLKDGKPAMAMGSPGGDDQCMRTMQTFLNIVEFGMNAQQAIEAPRWSTRSFPMSYFPHTMYPGETSVESRIPEDVRKALEAKGHRVKVSGAWSLGSNAAIVIDPATGVLSAGADPRADAYALAW
jgi:gamma-glutamyltranspeptidase / glutathione hydrolase